MKIKSYQSQQALSVKNAYNTWKRMKVRKAAIATFTDQEDLARLAINPYLNSGLRSYARLKITDKDLLRNVQKIVNHNIRMNGLRTRQKLEARWWFRVMKNIDCTYWKLWGLFHKKEDFDESMLDGIQLDESILDEV